MPVSRPTRASALNQSHALAGRLIHGYVFSEGVGTTRNLVQPAITASPQGGATWVTNTGGSAILTNPGAINSGLSIVIPQAPFHIVLGYQNPTNSGENQQAVLSNTLDGGGTYTQAAAPFYWFYDGTGGWSIDGNAYYANAATGSVSGWAEPAANVYTAGAHHLHLAATTTDSVLYHNGVNLGSSARIVPGTTPQPVIIGAAETSGWKNFRAEWDYVYIFQGTLTQGEIDDLRADPYALVVPATRFYLPSTGTATISPAFDSAWDDTSSVTSRPASTTRGTSAFAEITDTETSSSNTWDVCLGRYISEPLSAQTISGTVMGIIRARESNTAANARSQMVIRVVSGDGTTVRGTLLAQNNTTTNINEWVATTTVTAARNARFPVGSAAAALTSVTAQQGDRIVIEVGGRAVNTSTTSYTLGMRFGENAADLADNETGVVEGAPWIDFSAGIQFFTAPTAHNVAGAISAKKPSISATATQTFPARSVTGSITAKKPTVASTATQTFPARTLTGTLTAPQPTASGTAVVVLPNPALKFDGTTGHVRYPFTTALNFPDADWTLGIFASIANPAGNTQQTFVSTGSYGNTNTFNLLIQEAGNANAGRVDCIVRGSGSAITVSGANDTSLLDPTWRLWVVERVKATETLNIYYVPVNGQRTLYASISAAGLDAIVPATPAALATRAAPFVGSGVWMDGSIHTVFKIDALLSMGEMQSVAAGFDLINDLGRSPLLLTRLDGLVSPLANRGTTSGSAGTINGGVIKTSGPVFTWAAYVSGAVAATKPTISATATQPALGHAVSAAIPANKPTLAATATQTFPARAVVGAIAAKKPTIAATSTQTFPARAVSGIIAAKKPAIAATVTQTFPTRSVAGTITATKPTLAAAAVQVFPARSIAGAISAKKPTISATVVSPRLVAGAIAATKPTITSTATQIFPARAVAGTIAAKKPTAAGSAVQVFPARAVTATLTAPKPSIAALSTVSASSTSSFSSGFSSGFGTSSPVRNLAAELVAPKPSASGSIVQVFPARSLSGALAASKPTITAAAVQTFPARNLTATIAAKKPTATATAVQIFPARNVSGAIAAAKPALSATAIQVFPARSVTGQLAAKKPTASATATQVFPARSLTAAMATPKPSLTATLFQSQIGSITISSALVAPKPTITATTAQVFPARSLAGSLAAPKPAIRAFATETRRAAAALSAPKPTLRATAVQAAVGAVSATTAIAAKKPTIAATAGQVFPARNVAGVLAAKKPMLSASAVHPLPPHEATAELVATKPTAAGSLTQSFPERLILGTLAAPNPSIAGSLIQVSPERLVSAALAAPKPTIRGAMMRGVSQDAPELSNGVYVTGSVNPDVRFQGIFDLDVHLTGAIQSDVFLTGIIDQ